MTGSSEPSRVLRLEPDPLPTGTLTFLMTDVEGSTRLWESHPERMGAVMARHYDVIEGAVAEAGGRLVRSKGEGDSSFAVFTDPGAAMAAAIEVQRGLAREPSPDGIVVRARAAIHTGPAELLLGDYYGSTINRCARLRAVAHGGQVLVSAATAGVLGDGLQPGASLLSLGSHRLKDLAAKGEVFQLVHPDLRADFPPLRALGATSQNLPIQLSSFVGREREMGMLREHLLRERLVTLTGSGGCGKTRLALQVAAEVADLFLDGVWLLEMAPMTDANLLPQALAAALGIREASSPGVDSEHRPGMTAQLVENLRPLTALLVLDNCEHLVQGAAEFGAALLQGCPQLKIIATSREPLSVPGEVVVRVPSLTRPGPTRVPDLDTLAQYEAVRLFVERASLGQHDFQVDGTTAAAVVEIVNRLDGIPLALELAAARLRSMSVQQVAERLNDKFTVLTAGARTALTRHQTLRGAVDWSFQLLSEPEKVLFRRLSTFLGGWTLEAAEAVAPDAGLERGEVVSLLSRLVDKSLVNYDPAASRPRYTMLETIREYALIELRDSGEEEILSVRAREYYLELAAAAETELIGPHQQEWMERLDDEHDNLRAALQLSVDRVDAGAAIRLAGAIWRYWWSHGYSREGMRWIQLVLALEGGDDHGRAKLLNAAGNLSTALGSYVEATEYHGQALALRRRLGDPRQVGASLNNLAIAVYYLGDYGTARRNLEESIRIHRDLDDIGSAYMEMVNLGEIANIQGDTATGRRLNSEALVLARARGDLRSTAVALLNIGDAAYAEGNMGEAETFLSDALTIERGLEEGEASETLVALALVWRATGNRAAAIEALAEAEATSRRGGDPANLGRALRALARLRLDDRDVDGAGAAGREALQLALDAASKREIAESLHVLGAVAAMEHRPEQAALLYGAAEAIREQLGTPLRGPEAAEAAQAREALRGELGADRFEAWLKQGAHAEVADVASAALGKRPRG